MRESGIRVVLSEKVSDSSTVYSRGKAFLVSLVCWIYLLLGEWGVLFACNEAFALGVPIGQLILVTAIVSGGAALLLSFPKWRLYGLLILLTACVGFFIWRWEELTVGFAYIWESFGIAFDTYFHDMNGLGTSAAGIESQVLLAMIGISMLIALVMGSAIFLWKSMSVSLVLFGLVDGLILIVGLMPAVWVVMIQLIVLLGMSLLSGCHNRQAVFGTVTRIDARIGLRQKMQLQVSFGIVLLAAVIMYLVSALLLEPAYARVESAREATNELRQDIQNFTINDWDDFGFSLFDRGTMGLNGGKLGDYQSISGKKQTDLYITSDVSYSGTVYIKGFAAGLYAGDHWEQVLFQDWAENYYGTGTWELVPETNYVSQEYRNLLHLAAEHQDTEQIVVSRAMKVEVEGAREEYCYLPGFPQAAMLGSTMPLYGWAEQISPSASYVTILTSPDWLLEQIGTDFITSGAVYASYVPEDQTMTIQSGNTSLETEYDQFVRENYLQIPGQVLDRVRSDWEAYLQKYPYAKFGYVEDVEAETGVNVQTSGTRTYAEVAKRVRSYLAERAEYTMSPGKTPSGEDFIDYFLFEQEEGYCVHFASAATMLFRMSGIPARYVEGYTANGLEAGVKTVVMDTQAHAWCEIYISGFGWVPVDVTPGGREAASLPEDQQGSTAESPEETITETEPVTIAPEETIEVPNTVERETVEQPSQIPGQNAVEIPGASGRIGTELLEKFLTVMGILAGLLAVRFIIRKRSRLLLARKKTRLQQSNCRRAILAAYQYTVALTAHLPVGLELDASAEAFAKACPDGEEALFVQWKELVQEACFSCHEMTEENREAVLQFYRYMYRKSLTTGKDGRTISKFLQTCRRFWRTYGSCYPEI